jgi:type II secretory pathway pseudopilin PulG
MKRKKRALTLLEIMIVIFLITLITGVIGYNMKGSLEKGKIFRSRQAKEQLHDMLLLLLAEGNKPETILQNKKKALADLGIAKNPDNLLKDGWGDPFEVIYLSAKNDFKISSKNSSKYETEEE